MAEREPEWFDDEEFWIDLYPFLFTEERLGAAEEEIEGLLSLVPYQGGAVLDLCCGPGRHAVPLARRGLTVTGVDRSPHLLGRAEERGREAGVQVEWVRADMRDFVRPEAFDLAINMFTSFGYFDEREDDLLVLRNLRECLRPGGFLVMELTAKEWLAEGFHPTTSEELPDGSLLVQRHEIYDDWSRIRNEWILIRGRSVKRFRFHHTLYSGQELKDRLRQAGFTGVRLFGDLDGSAFGPHTKRLVAVASRPGG